jgi:hypothetical protein
MKSSSVLRVLNVSFRILLNAILGSLLARSLYVSAERRGWRSEEEEGGRRCRRRRSFQAKGRMREASEGSEGMPSRSMSCCAGQRAARKREEEGYLAESVEARAQGGG